MTPSFRPLLFMGLAACFGTLNAQPKTPEIKRDASQPPGVVIAKALAAQTEYLGSPSIVILPDGSYLASHDFFGKKGANLRSARIFSSTDRGQSWRQVAQLPLATWGTLFVHLGDVYHQGITHEYGDVVIRRSKDNGKTWSDPVDAKSGRLFKGQFHSAPVPVVVHGGRIWRAVEEVVNDLLWPRHFAAVVISAREDSDLLDAANWTRTNGVPFESAWVAGRRPGWLEGNVVITPEGGLVNLLRTNTEPREEDAFPLQGGAAGIPRYELAARAAISPDGKTLTFDPATGFFRLPGSQSKFTIRFDPVTKQYWSLVNKITLQHEGRASPNSPLRQRNVVMLISSRDLRQWEERTKVLRWREGAQLDNKGRHAIQYLDWQFDGDDLIAVARTAWDGQSYHNSNYLTFHRVKNFRTLTMADSPPDLAPLQ